MVFLWVLRSTHFTQIERAVFRRIYRLHLQFARSSLRRILSEVIGAIGSPGVGDLAIGCNRCFVFSELFVNTAKAEPHRGVWLGLVVCGHCIKEELPSLTGCG
jgi:hypothetical protein